MTSEGPGRDGRCSLAAGRGQVGAEVDDAHVSARHRRGQLGDAAAVGEHRRGRFEGALHGLAAGVAARRCVEHVAAVDRHDHAVPARRARRTASPAGTALWAWIRSNANERRRRRSARPSAGAAQAPQAWVGARARRRHVAHVGHVQPVAPAVWALGEGRAARGRRRRGPSDERGARGNQPVQHDHANLRSSVARGQRLAMSPNAQHRVALARVELRDDDDLHQRRWVTRVCWASLALR